MKVSLTEAVGDVSLRKFVKDSSIMVAAVV